MWDNFSTQFEKKSHVSNFSSVAYVITVPQSIINVARISGYPSYGDFS